MDMTEDFVQVLWDEGYGSNGFRAKLRVELTWDKAAFDRLTEAMRACCKHYALSDDEQRQRKQLEERVRKTSEKKRSEEEKAEETDQLAKNHFSEHKRWVPSELAAFFWRVPQFIRDWTDHEYWEKQRALEPEYFKNAYYRLDKLAEWFFWGECPWDDEEKGWASTFVK